MNLIKKIKTFKSIHIPMNSIVYCDIDDTIITYPEIEKNWLENNKSYSNIYDPLVINLWIDLLTKTKPIVTCKNYNFFYNKIKTKNSSMVLLTARSDITRNITLDHLNVLKLKYDDIIFCGGKSKGLEILKHNNDISINKIFIDDSIENLYDVINVHGDLIKCYHFCKK